VGVWGGALKISKREKRLRSLERSIAGCENRIETISHRVERLDEDRLGVLSGVGLSLRGGRDAVRLKAERELEQARGALHSLREEVRRHHSETAVERLGGGEGRQQISAWWWKDGDPVAFGGPLPPLDNLSSDERKAMLLNTGDVGLL
jgi:hypothetical protein